MYKKISLHTYLLFFLALSLWTTPTFAASCLDTGILGFIEDKNSMGYVENVFPVCVHMKQCTHAMKGLEKLKSMDMVKYSFLKGAALANGDCYTKDLKEAEKLLSFCAKYSDTCKSSLFNFYTLYAKGNKDFEKFALELALQGNPMAITYMADVNISKNTPEGLALGYFWGKIMYDLLQIKLYNTKNFYDNLPPDIQKNFSDSKERDIKNINEFLYGIQPEITRLQSVLNEKIVKKIDILVVPFIQGIIEKKSKQDELANIGNIYGVSGITQATPVKGTSKGNGQTLKKINPPQQDVMKEMEEYRRILAELRV